MSHCWSFPFFIWERRDLVVGLTASSQNAVWQSLVYLLLWFCNFFFCFFFSFEHQYCLHLNLQHDHFNGRNVHKASVKLQERLGWTVFDKCIESPKRQKKRRKTVLSPLVAVHHATLFYLLFQSEHFEIRSDVRNFYFENVMF